MGVPTQNSMGLPQQQAALAQNLAAGMMQQGMQPHSMQSIQSMQGQGLQPQGLHASSLHGDMMMQQHTHVQDNMGPLLGMDAFSPNDLLDDPFPNFPSPVVDTESSSSQQQGSQPAASQGISMKSESRLSSGSAPAPLTRDPSLQRKLRKLTVEGRAKTTGQGSTPDDLFSNAPQNVQMQMSMTMPVVGPGSWLSPSTLDTSKDGVRRPPAA